MIKIWGTGLKRFGIALALAGNVYASSVCAADKVVFGREGWLYPAWESTSDVYGDAVRRNLDLMARGARALQGAGVRVVVGVVPAKARVYPEYLPAGTAVSAEFQQFYREINERLRAGKVETLDLLSPLLAGKPEHPMYAQTDSHWTAYGADLVAKAVGQELRPSVADLAGQEPSGALPGFAQVPIEGDLSKLTGKRVIEQVWIRPESNSRNKDLLDDDDLWQAKESIAPEIALVCTSSCEPALGFPLVFSHAVGKPVDLFWRNGGVGHWKILFDYLGSLTNRRQVPPKVLLWIVMEGSLASDANDEAWRASGGRMTPEAWLAAVEKTAESWRMARSGGGDEAASGSYTVHGSDSGMCGRARHCQ